MATGELPFDQTQGSLVTLEATPVSGLVPGMLWTGVDLVQASIAENTRRAYEGALRQFQNSGHPETDDGVAAHRAWRPRGPR